MALGQTRYFDAVELSALEEHLSHLVDGVARLRQKAIKRSHLQAVDQINKLQTAIHLVQRRIPRMK